MNNSGVPLQKLVKFYKIEIHHILVIHDNLDLELGKTKLKIGGGTGGHNG